MTDAKIVIAETVKGAQKAKRSPKTAEEKSGVEKPPYDISFPDDFPIEPLGINGGDVYFLDQKKQLVAIKAEKLGKGTIVPLFGDQQALKYAFFPRWGEDGNGRPKVTGWRPEQAADCLYAEAARRGLWDILERVRGPGCWKDIDGGLVMHCGDLIFHGDNALTPRQIGRHVYPAAPPKPHPAEDRKAGVDAAEELLTILKTWAWRRPDLDPHLLLGWIGAAMLGGALKWRPLVWMTGDKASGKSTLQELIKGVMGAGGIINSTDATAAGLWQSVGHASLPVALDEIEAEEDNRKAHNIIKLARQAASGGQTLRGGSDHKNASFTVRSCFLFSSILIPPMLGQDISRMAVLQLDKLLDGAKAPNLSEKKLNAIGEKIRARLLQQWPRFITLLETWQAQLVSVGHSGRSADQFGTLMACYDVLTSDADPDSDTLAEWGELLKRQGLEECQDDISDHERCLGHLMTTQLDLMRSGERRTVGSWVLEAAGKDPTDEELFPSADTIKSANKALGNVGLLVKKETSPGGRPYFILHVANDHQGLSGLFRDTHWSGRSGTSGVWVQAMRRIKGSQPSQQRFNGTKLRCTAVPLDEIFDDIFKPKQESADA